MNKIKDFFKRILSIIFKNKILSIIILLIIVIASIVIIKNSYAFNEGENYIKIACPETASGGDEIECIISLNTVTINGLAVQADFNASEGMEFSGFSEDTSCTGNACWKLQGATENALIFFSKGMMESPQVYVNGLHTLGKVKYRIPNTAKSNEEYSVTLANVLLGGNNLNGDIAEINPENVTANIRIKSDINTLEGINLSNGSINEEVRYDLTDYTATVNSEKVTLNVEKTDEHSIVSGDVGELTLHYGTNNFNIIVTSETDIEKVYKISIKRLYEFDSDKYVYSKQDNYLYTGNDIASETILSNISLPSELNASIANNKYIVNYENEKLLEIDIINIQSRKYKIEDGNIYISKNIDYLDLINDLTLNGVSIKVFNKSGSEINSGTLTKDDILKVYYDNTELQTYEFSEEFLDMTKLKVDETNKVINKIDANTTYNQLIDNISTTGIITINDKYGAVLNGTDKVKTGDIIKIELISGIVEYSVSVLGDVNGDGQVNIMDILKISDTIVNKTELSIVSYNAADVDANGSINVMDIIRIANSVVNKTKLQ